MTTLWSKEGVFPTHDLAESAGLDKALELITK